MGYGERWEAPLPELYQGAKKGSTADAQALLDKISRERLCAPAVVVEVGGTLLNNGSLPTQSLYAVWEAVGQSASTLGLKDWVNASLEALAKKFGKGSESARIARLHLQVLDANTLPGHTRPKQEVEVQSKRLKQLEEKKEWINVRRILAHHRANRSDAGASAAEVEEIQATIETYGASPDPWLLLAARYLEQQHLSKAAFCLEEMLLHDHGNIAALIAYAELQAGIKELDTARKYFAHAAILDEKHPRALWGLLTVNTRLIAEDKKGGSMTTESAIQLHKFTVEKLVAVYEPLAKGGAKHAQLTLDVIKAIPKPKPLKEAKQ